MSLGRLADAVFLYRFLVLQLAQATAARQGRQAVREWPQPSTRGCAVSFYDDTAALQLFRDTADLVATTGFSHSMASKMTNGKASETLERTTTSPSLKAVTGLSESRRS